MGMLNINVTISNNQCAIFFHMFQKFLWRQFCCASMTSDIEYNELCRTLLSVDVHVTVTWNETVVSNEISHPELDQISASRIRILFPRGTWIHLLGYEKSDVTVGLCMKSLFNIVINTYNQSFIFTLPDNKFP